MPLRCISSSPNQAAILTLYTSQPYFLLKQIKKESYLSLKIQSLLNSIESPPPLKFIENLVTNTNYCIDCNCYRNTHFQYDSRNLQIMTEKYEVTLITKVLLTCALHSSASSSNSVSIYHNALCRLEGTQQKRYRMVHRTKQCPQWEKQTQGSETRNTQK